MIIKKRSKYKIVDSEYIECPYCNKNLQMLHWGHLKKLHNKTIEDVNIEFPNIPSMTKKESDRRQQKATECSYKVIETCNKKYGGIGFRSKELAKKSNDVTKEKFGVENVMKNSKISNLFKGLNGIPSKNKSPERAKKISKALKGRPSSLKGKTYLEIHGHEKTKRLIEEKRISGAIACSKCTNPSIPQVQLYKLTKEIYSESILNYTVDWYCIDIAIPSKKIAIEYDGSYWHQDTKKDLERQKDLEKMGWKFIRYIDKLPSKDSLINDIQTLETNKKIRPG